MDEIYRLMPVSKQKQKSIKGGNQLEVELRKHGHFWLDCGLTGLIKMLEQVDVENVKIQVEDNALTLSGNLDDIQMALENACDLLVDKYYNLSTKKQIEERSSYNFYYDTKKDEFISFPKKKSVGIAGIICNTYARPTVGSIKWKDKKKCILPDEYQHLQQRMEKFVSENGLKITTAGLLVDGPNAVQPKFRIVVDEKKKGKRCYLCGGEVGSLEDANQTIFPFITGSSGILSFNSNAGGPEKICWKCSLLGKFVPVVGFYSTQGGSLSIFLPYSPSLKKMCEAHDLLESTKYTDDNLYRNYNHPLGGFYQHPYEITYAFLYSLYDKCLLNQPEIGTDGIHLDMEAALELTYNTAPLEFYVIQTQKEGDTFAGKMIWPFRETLYFFRLTEKIEKTIGVRMKEVLSYCVDYEASKNENKTLLRNRICERILKKQSILDLVEKHVFHTNISYFKPLFDMLLIYELLLREGDMVFKEEQEAAVSLGKCIGRAVGNSDSGKKGDLFALRKCRRKVDFLEQLNRLQFRLGNDFLVPKEVYEGKLTDDNFHEFKQFCMVAALNTYNAVTSEKNKKKEAK